MCKKLFLLSLFALVFGLVLTGPVGAELIGWWTFDEGSGNTAFDLSGLDNNGTLQGDPQWVEGINGGALELDGSGDWVAIDGIADDLTENNFTVMAWIKTTQSGDGNVVASNDTGGGHDFVFGVDGGNLLVEADSVNTYPPTITDDEWHHIAYTREGSTAFAYTDGELVGTETPSGDQAAQARWSIGQEWDSSPSDFYQGLVDDVKIFNHPLTQDEILGAMVGTGFPQAGRPDPADGAFVEDTWATLTWRAGDHAATHDVYLGTSFDEVSGGAGDTFQGNQSTTEFIIGFPGFPFPEGLVPGTTYYWRVDEVNDSEPNSPWTGDVWSFMMPPKTAYSPDPADGTGFVDPNATFSWTPGYGAKLHTVYMGTSYEDVSNASGGQLIALTTHEPGPLELEKVYYWRVDEFDPPFTHKGDIWSFTTPGAVGNPQPANGAAGVQMIATLDWTPADNAVSHELYFGTDAEAVKNATKSSPEYVGPKTLGSESYDPGGLAWDSSYAWRVDEVYPAETVKGLVWTFTTADFLLVDNFEAYNDIDPPDEASNRIFDKWIDGFGTTTNGALVGNDLPPYAEQTIVHGGDQSMIYSYDNANKTSEATLTLVWPRDWTLQGVTKLSMWVRGRSANAADRIFVALNGTAVVYHDDPAATQLRGWNEWVIDLAAFGVDLTNVSSVTIGIGTKNAPAPGGGTGTVYFDDIKLVP